MNAKEFQLNTLMSLLRALWAEIVTNIVAISIQFNNNEDFIVYFYCIDNNDEETIEIIGDVVGEMLADGIESGKFELLKYEDKNKINGFKIYIRK